MRLMRVRRLGVLTAAGLGRMPMIGVVQVGAAGSLGSQVQHHQRRRQRGGVQRELERASAGRREPGHPARENALPQLGKPAGGVADARARASPRAWGVLEAADDSHAGEPAMFGALPRVRKEATSARPGAPKPPIDASDRTFRESFSRFARRR